MATRKLVVVALLLVCAVSAGFYVAARPYLPKHAAEGIRLPDRKPAQDASGAAGWVWPDGVPGWKAGATYGGIDVSGVQPVEVDPARLAAARAGLDADGVRVVLAAHFGRRGALGILAAPALGTTPVRTCLGALLEGDVPVAWVCPNVHVLSHKHVFLVARGARIPSYARRVNTPDHAIIVMGVARGDVWRIVFEGGLTGRETLYVRGKSWGQFETAQAASLSARLLVYGHHRLLETIPLNIPSGQQRILR